MDYKPLLTLLFINRFHTHDLVLLFNLSQVSESKTALWFPSWLSDICDDIV